MRILTDEPSKPERPANLTSITNDPT
jgi:hypothetical protein